MVKIRKFARYFCNLFPVWTLLTAVTALRHPQVFLGIPPSTFPAQIGVLMLCMGITLTPRDFRRVAEKPDAVGLAFLGCYGVMPILALIIGKLMHLEPSLAAGLVLVACINGAQASNLCTYIGQGDLALSVLMTTMTTVGSILFTPLMGKLLLGQVVPVNAPAIAMSTIQVVLAPILFGMSFNAKFPKTVQAILPFSPILGVIITCLLVGTSVAGCATPILSAGFKLQASAFLLHALGGLAGYFLTKPFYGEDVCRTFAIEFAMKSSAFGYLLATLHFSDFAVRVPSAVSIVWMTLSEYSTLEKFCFLNVCVCVFEKVTLSLIYFWILLKVGSSMAVASRFFPPKECIVDQESL
jgi:BASS family bile acid:Na+ symporter